MAKKSLKKEKTSSSLRTSEKNSDSETTPSCEKVPENYTCTGNFKEDFTKLCEQHKPSITPIVKIRPLPPTQQQQKQQQQNEQEQAKKNEKKSGNKHGRASRSPKSPKASKQQQKQPLDVLDRELMQKLGVKICDPPEQESPPSTFTTTSSDEFFQPSVQVSSSTDGADDDLNNIQKLIIRGWRVDGVMMKVMHESLLLQLNLHTLDLWGAGIDDETLPQWASLVSKLPSIRTLCLDNNPVCSEDWWMFVQKPCSVQHLSLRHNRIGCVGGHKLGHHLGNHLEDQSNKSLISLNLSANQLGDDGATLLFECLKFNTTLSFIDVSDNCLTDQTACHLAPLLSEFAMSDEEWRWRRQLQLQLESVENNEEEEEEEEDEEEEAENEKEHVLKGSSSKTVPAKSKSSKQLSRSSVNQGSSEGAQKAKEPCDKQQVTINRTMLGETRCDPDDATTTYMLGNFSLLSLNMSRNHLHCQGLEALLRALNFQADKLQQQKQQQHQNFQQQQLQQQQQSQGEQPTEQQLQTKSQQQQQQQQQQKQQTKPQTEKQKQQKILSQQQTQQSKLSLQQQQQQQATALPPMGPGLLRLSIQSGHYTQEDCGWYTQIEEIMLRRNPLVANKTAAGEEEEEEEEEDGGGAKGDNDSGAEKNRVG